MNSTVSTLSLVVCLGSSGKLAQNVAKEKQPISMCFKANGVTWLGQFQHKNNRFCRKKA